MPKKDIRSMDISEIKSDFELFGEKSFRATQVYKWLAGGTLDFDNMTNLSKDLRLTLNEKYFIPDVEIEQKFVSALDGTVKYLYKLYDGEYIESVVMKYEHGYTVCISTQVGCRMGCSFCASGINGLVRNLLPSEMLAQVMKANTDNNIRISNIVLMGMGEPLDNFDNVVKFLKLVSDSDGLNVGLRHISLSTSGVVPGIYKLSECEMPITLSISLHAPFDDLRSQMMKVNRKWKISELLKACRDYQKVTGRRISFEYAMIKGVNDTDACANELAKILKGIMCHVNLIPVNPIKETTYEKSDRKALVNFCDKLNGLGINTTIRRTLGSDINASCGQLRRKYEEKGGGSNENIQ